MITAALGRNICRGAFGVGVVTIVVLSLLSQPSMPDIDMSDKTGHFLAYGGVMTVGGLGFWSDRQRIILVIGLFLLGITMELLQGLTADRHMSLLDIGANSGGILTGLILAVSITWAVLWQDAKKA